jgi:hypothetical protein
MCRARVLCESAEWDLALLTVDEDDFWTAPLEVINIHMDVYIIYYLYMTFMHYEGDFWTPPHTMYICVYRSIDIYREGLT